MLPDDRHTRTLLHCAAMTLAAFASTGCFMASPALMKVGAAPEDLGATSVEFASTSGSTLHAWLSRGRAGMGALLMLHGVGGNRSTMLARAEFFHKSGYTILAPDFQAHGESDGEHITFGVLESRDAEAAFNYLKREAPGERIGIIGVSMGGAAALLSPQTLSADAMVLESVYPTIDDAVNDRLHVWFGPLGFLSDAVTPLFVKIVGGSIGVDDDQLRPIDRIGRVNAPILVVAGTDDRYTTIQESQDLYDHARGEKAFWAVPGATHEDIYDFDPHDYQRIVGGFLARHLQGAQVVSAK